jgi:copper homeostasis protein
VQNLYLLEIAVANLEAAVAAERGGADRIELSSELSVGGITPDFEVLCKVRQQIHIPIFVMIRPRAGDFVYSVPELQQMKENITAAKELEADGLVLGILTPQDLVDIGRSSELVALAKPLPVTFHRAFDAVKDLRRALEDVMQTGADRILTSGGKTTAVEGAAEIATLVAAARERITIVPGAGINARNISQAAIATRANEFHSGLSSVLPYLSGDYLRFEDEVRQMRAKLNSIPQSPIQKIG